MGENSKDIIDRKINTGQSIYFILFFVLVLFEAYTYWKGGQPLFVRLLILTYSFIFFFEITTFYFQKREIYEYLLPIILLILAPMLYIYGQELYPSGEYMLFIWLYIMCLSKLATEAINPENIDSITPRTVIIIFLLAPGLYYTQIAFGPKEWIGSILLPVGFFRVMFSVEIFFNRKS